MAVKLPGKNTPPRRHGLLSFDAGCSAPPTTAVRHRRHPEPLGLRRMNNTGPIARWQANRYSLARVDIGDLQYGHVAYQ